MDNSQRSPINILENQEPLPLPVGEEKEKDMKTSLEKILEEDEAALQITSPYGAEKISTNRRERASFDRMDERSVEEAIRRIPGDTKQLKLVVNGPGGRIDSSNKIARSLDNNFENIEAYVPHYAKSGATLVSLAGDKIIMGEISDLGPLDPQIGDREEQYSTTDLTGAYERWLDEWSNKHPEEASAPEKSMLERMDILEYEKAQRYTSTMIEYAAQLLSSKKGVSEDEARDTARDLVGGYPIHGYTLTAGEAEETLPEGMIVPESERQDEMEVMRNWMDKYAFDKGSNHAVVYFSDRE